MGTKLESLVEVLTEGGYERMSIERLIVDYFGNQDDNEFETDEGVFVVLHTSEMHDILYEKAQDLYDEKRKDLEKLISKSGDYYMLDALVSAIDKAEATGTIAENLDYCDEEDCSLISNSGRYSIYLRNE